jgi:integrase
MIRQGVGVVPYADYIYTMIYTGFRPSEFLALTHDSYDKTRATLTGGAKTDAGRGRVVTLSPKIKSIVEARFLASGSFLFGDAAGGQFSLQNFTERYFYPALEAVGIDNPIVEIAGGVKRRKYTPHTCRHTFATLMKRVQGAEKDKLELIGHASGEMLRYYQDAALDDLRRITNAL